MFTLSIVGTWDASNQLITMNSFLGYIFPVLEFPNFWQSKSQASYRQFLIKVQENKRSALPRLSKTLMKVPVGCLKH